MYSEIDRVQNGSSNPEIYDVRNMHFLLATVYESARLLPAGSLLQRCLVNCGMNSIIYCCICYYMWMSFLFKFLTF